MIKLLSYTNWLLPVLLVFGLGLSQAIHAVPQHISYQGLLSDSSGNPISGAVNLTFRLYPTETGGSPSWTEAHSSVNVSQGIFTVQLGSETAFAGGLFSTPLWLSSQVATDAEMSPRQPLSAVPYAHKAKDAETLDGETAANLDQSAHLADTENPHQVTATHVGAPTTGDLTNHTGNTGNPHGVTATQAGAVASSAYSTHTGNAAAHHPRYTNVEAAAAMGTTANSNPLNHNRYTDTASVAAIKAADGAGSTLDADLLDGMQANEIIDAASDEVRTPISSLPFNIFASGSYYVTGNLDGSAGGIDILVDDVTLDLMGFTLDGGGAVADNGIKFTGRSNVTIYNGTVRGFGFTALLQGNSTARYTRVIDVRVLGNGTLGTNSNSYSGIALWGTNNLILRCTAGDNGYWGIFAGPSSIIKDSAAYNNQSWGIYSNGSGIVRSNTAYRNNQAQTANTGGIKAWNDSLIIDNNAHSNYHSGIYVASGGSVLRNNHATDSIPVEGVSQCIYFSSSVNAAIGNTATGCTTEFAGSLPPASRFIDNIAW